MNKRSWRNVRRAAAGTALMVGGALATPKAFEAAAEQFDGRRQVGEQIEDAGDRVAVGIATGWVALNGALLSLYAAGDQIENLVQQRRLKRAGQEAIESYGQFVLSTGGLEFEPPVADGFKLEEAA